jgi:hypothetical protein
MSLIHGEDLLMNGMITPIEIAGTEAEIMIQGNKLENIQWGIFVMNNTGPQTIRDNTVRLNPVDDKGAPLGFVWGGISLQNIDPDSYHASVLIEKNYVYSKAAAFFAGILCLSGNAVIQENKIELDQIPESIWPVYGDSSGIMLRSLDKYSSSNTLVRKNTMTGSGQTGIFLESQPELGPENCTIEDNFFEDFILQEIPDAWARSEGNPISSCPTHPGASYHLSQHTSNNSITDTNWRESMVLLDDTSDINPYDPTTYNGVNRIKLGK